MRCIKAYFRFTYRWPDLCCTDVKSRWRFQRFRPPSLCMHTKHRHHSDAATLPPLENLTFRVTFLNEFIGIIFVIRVLLFISHIIVVEMNVLSYCGTAFFHRLFSPLRCQLFIWHAFNSKKKYSSQNRRCSLRSVGHDMFYVWICINIVIVQILFI